MLSYRHKEIGKEIKTISGYFAFLEEICLNIKGRNILCAVGVAIIDNSCCGIGGCEFVEVSGYILSWKFELDQLGHFISKVEPIDGEEEKREIRSILEKLYPHSQINFMQ